MPSHCTPTRRKRSATHATLNPRFEDVAIARITSPKLLGGGAAARSTLPHLVIPTDQARLIQALYPPVLTPLPDDPDQYLALTNTATIQWLVNGLVVDHAMPTKVLALVVECPGWTIEQIQIAADYLGPLVLGWQRVRDRRACHQALKRAGLPIPREPLLAELMRHSGGSPAPKHGR